MEKLNPHTINNILDKIESEFTYEVCPDPMLNKKVKRILQDIDLSDVDSFLKSNLKHSFKLLQTDISKFAIKSMFSVCNNKDQVSRILYVTSHIYYNSLLNKYIKYCNDLILSKAFEEVKSSNLFRKLGVDNTLKHLSSSLSSKVTCNLTDIIKILYILRHRIAQSLKSVVAKYYLIYHQSKQNIRRNYERYVELLIRKILFYGYIKTPDACSDVKHILSKLVYADDELLTKSIQEIFDLLTLEPSKQKIINNLHKLEHTKSLLKSLTNEPLTNKLIYCYILTIYYTLKEE